MAFGFKNGLTPPTPLFFSTFHENDQREKYKTKQNKTKKTVPTSERTGENAMNRAEYLRDLGSTAEARAGEAGERERRSCTLAPQSGGRSSPRGPGSRGSSPCSPAPYFGAGFWSWPCREMCPVPPLYSHSIQPTARGCAKVVLQTGEGPKEEAQDAMCKHSWSLSSVHFHPSPSVDSQRRITL